MSADKKQNVWPANLFNVLLLRSFEIKQHVQQFIECAVC